MGTGVLPGHIWKPEMCPGNYGLRKGIRAYIGTEWRPSTYEHCKCARALMCTGIVPGHIWANIGTGMVSGQIRAPE